MTCKTCGSYQKPQMIGRPKPLELGFTFFDPLPHLFACPDCGVVTVNTNIFRPKKTVLRNETKEEKP